MSIIKGTQDELELAAAEHQHEMSTLGRPVVRVDCPECGAHLRVLASHPDVLPVHHRADRSAWEPCHPSARPVEPVDAVVQAWGMAAEATDTAEMAGGYLIPNDVLERLGATVEAMAAPLVGLAAQLAAERDQATEDATRANATANDLVRALSDLVENYPETSWAGSNDALQAAVVLLESLQATPEG